MKVNSQQKTRVLAVVAPGSSNNARYDFDFGSWEPSDNSITMLFSRYFDPEVDDLTLLKSVEELQKIILALFLTDSIPRKIHFFEYGEGLSKEHRGKFLRVLGQRRTYLETEQTISFKSVVRVGLSNMPRSIDSVADKSVIKSWFEFLSQNPHISSSLQLIQESFGLAHELHAGLRITNFAELSTVLLLLVSGLESVFIHSADSNADISFKFRTVGAAFYSKFVGKIPFEDSDPFQKGKFKYKDFKDILRILYSLRSSIAHGGFGFDFFNKAKIRDSLDDLFTKVGVGEVRKDMKSIYFGHLLIALAVLENHILEIFRTAKANLNKGVKILDEMLDDEAHGPKAA